MTDNASPRTLDQIAEDIRSKTETIADAIAIGGLLLEAQERVDHGGWLLWLDQEFDFSARTAQNYMSSHEFASKYETVSHLRLTCSALYALSSGAYTDDEVNAVLTVAVDERVNRGRLEEIISGLKMEEEEAAEEQESDGPPGQGMAQSQWPWEADAEEAEAILDGPPPELPPTEDAPAVDHLTPAFKAAVDKLCELRTKPVAKFKELAAQPQVMAAAEFLQHVVEAGNDSCDQVAEGDATVETFCMEWARSKAKQIFETADSARRAAMVAFIKAT